METRVNESKSRMATEFAVVNLDTGEIVRQLCHGDKVQCVDSTPKQEKDAFYYFNPDESFVKLWDAVIPEIIGVRLSGAEMAILLFLAGNVSYDSFIVMDKDGRHLNSFDIETALNLSPATVKKAIKTLRDKGFISVARTAKAYTYIANPYVFARGKRCNSTLTELFMKTPQYRRLVISSSRKKERVEGEKLYFPEDATFIRLWVRVLPYIVDVRLTGAELMILLACFQAARYETGLIAHGNGIPCRKIVSGKRAVWLNAQSGMA